MLTERICCDLMFGCGDGERRAPIKRKSSGIHDHMNNIFGYYGYTFLHRGRIFEIRFKNTLKASLKGKCL